MTSNELIKIHGRICLNFWKIARNDLELRTTEFEGTIEEVTGFTLPKFPPETLTRWWSGKISD